MENIVGKVGQQLNSHKESLNKQQDQKQMLFSDPPKLSFKPLQNVSMKSSKINDKDTKSEVFKYDKNNNKSSSIQNQQNSFKLILNSLEQQDYKSLYTHLNNQTLEQFGKRIQFGVQYFYVPEDKERWQSIKNTLQWKGILLQLENKGLYAKPCLVLLCENFSQYFNTNTIYLQSLVSWYLVKERRDPFVSRFLNTIDKQFISPELETKTLIQNLNQYVENTKYFEITGNLIEQISQLRKEIFKELLNQNLTPIQFMLDIVKSYNNIEIKTEELEYMQKFIKYFFFDFINQLQNSQNQKIPEIKEQQQILLFLNKMKSHQLIIQLISNISHSFNIQFDEKIMDDFLCLFLSPCSIQYKAPECFVEHYKSYLKNMKLLQITIIINVLGIRKLFNRYRHQQYDGGSENIFTDLIFNKKPVNNRIKETKSDVSQMILHIISNINYLKDKKNLSLEVDPLDKLYMILKNKSIHEMVYSQKELGKLLRDLSCLFLGNALQQSGSEQQIISNISCKMLILSLKFNQDIIQQFHKEQKMEIPAPIDLYFMKTVFGSACILQSKYKYKIMDNLLTADNMTLLSKFQVLSCEKGWYYDIYQQWFNLLKNCKESLENFQDQNYLEDLKQIKNKIIFVCNCIIKNPQILENIETLIIGKGVTGFQGGAMIVLMLDSFSLFSRMEFPDLKLLRIILYTLQNIFETRNYQQIFLNLIQIYPKSFPVQEDFHPIFSLFFFNEKYGVNYIWNNQQYFLLVKRLIKFGKSLFLQLLSPFDEFPQVSVHESQTEYEIMVLLQMRYDYSSAQVNEQVWASIDYSVLEKNWEVKAQSNFLDNYLDYIYGYIANLSFKFDSKIFKKCQILTLIFELTSSILWKFMRNKSINSNALQIESTFKKNIAKYLNKAPIAELILHTFAPKQYMSVGVFDVENLYIQNNLICMTHHYTQLLSTKKNKKSIFLLQTGCELLENIITVIGSIDPIITNSRVNVLQKFLCLFSGQQEHYYQIDCINTEFAAKQQYKINFYQAFISVLQERYPWQSEIINTSFSKVQKQLQREENNGVMNYEQNLQKYFKIFNSSLDYSHVISQTQKKKIPNGEYSSSLFVQVFRVLGNLIIYWQENQKNNLMKSLCEVKISDNMNVLMKNYYRLSSNVLLNILLCQIERSDYFQEQSSILDFLLACFQGNQKQILHLILTKNKKCIQNCEIISQVYYNHIIENFKNQNGTRTTNKLVNLFFQMMQYPKEYKVQLQQIKKLKEGDFFLFFTKKLFRDLSFIKKFQNEKEMDNLQSYQFFHNFDIKNHVLLRKILKEHFFDCKAIVYDSLGVFSLILIGGVSDQDGGEFVKTCLPYIKSQIPNILDQNFQELDNFQIQFFSFLKQQLSSLYDKNSSDISSQIFESLMQNINQPANQNEIKKNIFDFNLYGLGREYLINTNQIIEFLEFLKCNNRDINIIVALVHNFCCQYSILETQFKFLENFQMFFGLICSISNQNVGMSVTSCNSEFLFLHDVSSTHDIRQDQFLYNIIYPNNNLKFCCQFYDFFGAQNFNKDDKIFNEFKEITNIVIVKMLERNESLGYFEIYLKIVSSILGCMRYILDRFSLDNQRKKNVCDMEEDQQDDYITVSDILSWNSFFVAQLRNFQGSEQVLFNVFQVYVQFLGCVECFYNTDSKQLDNVILSGGTNMVEVISPYIKKYSAYQILAVICLHSLLKINQQQFIDSLTNNRQFIINEALQILFVKENQNIQTLNVIGRFLIDICWTKKGAALLHKNNLVGIFNFSLKVNHIQKMEVAFSATEHGNYERNTLHINWCWILAIMKDYIINILDNGTQLLQSLSILEKIQERLNNILMMPLFLSYNEGNFMLFKQQDKPIRQPIMEFSLSYLQELDLIIQLLTVFFSADYEIIRTNCQKEENILKEMFQNISKYTLLLFNLKKNSDLSDNFKPYTALEQKLLNIFCRQGEKLEPIKLSHQQIFDKQMQSSAQLYGSIKDFSPQQRKKPSASIVSNPSTDGQYKVLVEVYMKKYDPNMFRFNLEMTIRNIAYSVLMCMTKCLAQCEQRLIQQPDKFNQLILSQWEGIQWENVAENLYQTQKFLLDIIMQLIYKNQTLRIQLYEYNRDKIVHSGLYKLQALYGSVQFGQDQGFLNSLVKIPELDQLILEFHEITLLMKEVCNSHSHLWKIWKKQNNSYSTAQIDNFKKTYEIKINDTLTYIGKCLGQEMTESFTSHMQLERVQSSMRLIGNYKLNSNDI